MVAMGQRLATLVAAVQAQEQRLAAMEGHLTAMESRLETQSELLSQPLSPAVLGHMADHASHVPGGM